MFKMMLFQCSVPCGYGTKQRKVVCKTSGVQCDLEHKPAEEHTCYSGRSCDDGRSRAILNNAFCGGALA